MIVYCIHFACGENVHLKMSISGHKMTRNLTNSNCNEKQTNINLNKCVLFLDPIISESSVSLTVAYPTLPPESKDSKQMEFGGIADLYSTSWTFIQAYFCQVSESDSWWIVLAFKRNESWCARLAVWHKAVRGNYNAYTFINVLRARLALSLRPSAHLISSQSEKIAAVSSGMVGWGCVKGVNSVAELH